MYYFSKSSKEKLETCHPLIQDWLNEIIKYRDCTVAWGYRDKIEQDEMFADGLSKCRYPDSKHNKDPSLAVDVYPYANGRMVNGDQEGDDVLIDRFIGFAQAIAAIRGIPIKNAAEWTTFKGDLGHWELYKNV